MKSKKNNEIEIQKVAQQNSKIPFTLVIKGEWDWNKDFAVPTDYFGVSPLRNFNFAEEASFKTAFQKYIADITFDRCKNMFETILLSEIKLDPQIIQAYKTFQEATKAEKQKKEREELEAAQRHVVELQVKIKELKSNGY